MADRAEGVGTGRRSARRSHLDQWFAVGPPGIRHGFRAGAARSRKLNLYTPAAMVGYFDQLSAAIKGGDVDPIRLDEIARKHGMKVIGPVPEGYL